MRQKAGFVHPGARATYELIRDEFNCAPHGTVTVKGKGEMEVWHVIGDSA